MRRKIFALFPGGSRARAKQGGYMDITVLNLPKCRNLGVKIFITLFSLADEAGRIRTNKDALAKYFKVDRRTIGNHINDLVSSGVMKYKYSGAAFINPRFYYIGAPDRRDSVIEEYENFKSDVV